MNKKTKYLLRIIWNNNLLTLLIGIGLIINFLPAFSASKEEKALIRPKISLSENWEEKLIIVQESFLSPISNPFSSGEKTISTMQILATAYSSTPWETWGDPFITASGSRVRNGIIANNYLKFGTKIRIPELYGDKIFVVEDRMHSRKPGNQIDIWFPSNQEAKNFGVQKTYIEILNG